MVPLLLFLILLVIAWPVFAIFGGTLLLVLGSHLHIIVPTVLLSIAYVAFLAPIAKRNNIKLGGKFGEALDPSKPIGPAFQRMTHDTGNVRPTNLGFFSAPDQWKRVPRDPDHKPQHDQVAAKAKTHSPKRTFALAALLFIVCAPLTVVLLDTAKANGLFQASPSTAAVASQPSASTGSWFVRTGEMAMLDAKAGTNFLGQPVSLTTQCIGDRLSLRFDFRDYLGPDVGSDDFKTIFVGFGKGAYQQFQMALGPDKTSLLAEGKSRELIQRFRHGASLSVYTSPYNSEPVSASFDTTGAQEALSSILESCPPPKPYFLPERVTLSFHGDQGMIYVRKTGRQFPFSRTTPPGSELLYGDCRVSVGFECDVGLTVEDGKLVKIWSAFVPVGSP